jgi:hypothetical protein
MDSAIFFAPLLSKNEARRNVANIAKLPELVGGRT